MLSYYNNISACLQGTYLFNTSIRENLLYIKPDATEEEMKDVCERALILDDVLAMPDKWDTAAETICNKHIYLSCS